LKTSLTTTTTTTTIVQPHSDGDGNGDVANTDCPAANMIAGMEFKSKVKEKEDDFCSISKQGFCISRGPV
jgi:hypothetical protein